MVSPMMLTFWLNLKEKQFLMLRQAMMVHFVASVVLHLFYGTLKLETASLKKDTQALILNMLQMAPTRLPMRKTFQRQSSKLYLLQVHKETLFFIFFLLFVLVLPSFCDGNRT
mmetsp:Transcript_1128/g.2030  ORF Transcript_1128/g.2030 Transcript_1128/m.2030 type:complete len:113 (+) Transcript_1128:739-1077(+)